MSALACVGEIALVVGRSGCSVLLLPLLLVSPSVDPAPLQDTKPPSMRIGPYDFQLPPWWDWVKVDVPETVKTSQDVSEHVRRTYGQDNGTEENWKEALKAHALGEQRIKGFPVYIAHCYMTGDDYDRAAEVYAGLWELADTQPQHRDWYRCFLAYNAGLAYALSKDSGKARMWSLRAAAYVGHKDEWIAYYARMAEQRARSHDR